MLEENKISARQLTILTALFIIGGSVLVMPSQLATEAKQDAWMAALAAMVIGIMFLPLYIALGKRLQGRSLIGYMEIVLGKALGKTVAFVFITAFMFAITGQLLRTMGDFIITQMMPETPIEAIFILFSVIIVMATRLGLEPLARSAEIFFPVIVLLFFVLVIFLIPEIHPDYLKPVLEEGVGRVLAVSYLTIGFPFLEVVIFLMFYPQINRPDRVGKALFWGVLIGGGFLAIMTFLSIAVIGADLTTRNIYPSYALTKKISVGHFLERIESLMAVMWFLTGFYRTTILFYASVAGLAQVLSFKNYQFLSLPLGMIMVVFALVVRPSSAYAFQSIPAWASYVLIFNVLLPLLLLGLSAVRKKAGKHART
jgi:spore germination protein KB